MPHLRFKPAYEVNPHHPTELVTEIREQIGIVVLEELAKSPTGELLIELVPAPEGHPSRDG